MKTANSSISLSTILFVVFLILKLTNVITWSWWWVTAPLWIPAGLSLSILLIVVIIALCVGVNVWESFKEGFKKALDEWDD